MGKKQAVAPCGKTIDAIRAGDMVEVLNTDRRYARENPTYLAAQFHSGKDSVPALFTHHEVSRAVKRARKEFNLDDVPVARRKTILRKLDNFLHNLLKEMEI